MDWFEILTGFREADYDGARAKLKVEGTRLRSLVNDKDYGIGDLELVSLQSLRERVESTGGLPGRLKVSVVTGDVRQMHRSPENTGALFQVASQFNLLEMVSPAVTPEQGSIACPSANNVSVRSPYRENPSQNCCSSSGLVFSTFATRFNDIGTPLTIFWSSRSSRTAKAAVPKYANLRSDAITSAMRAGSLGGDCRSIRSSNTSDICGPLRS
jgi:hypothetical protein